MIDAQDVERYFENGSPSEAGPEFVSSPIEKKPCAINLTLQTWQDFINADYGELPAVIQGLTPDAGLVAFHGRGKDGKTTFAIHACAGPLPAANCFWAGLLGKNRLSTSTMRWALAICKNSSEKAAPALTTPMY